MPLPDEKPFLRYALPERPEVAVAQITYGLTLYLDEGLTWAKGAAAEALSLFLDVAPRASLRWLKTSVLPEWQRINERDLLSLGAGLTVGWTETRVRHRFRMQLADDQGAPAAGVDYQELDEHCDGRTSVLQLALPPALGHAALLHLATELGSRFPYWSGIGGWVATWDDGDKATAFRCLLGWCKRSLGLDVQVPDEMARYARAALPGTGWLTLVGSPLAQARAIDLAGLAAQKWETPATVKTLPRGLLIRAGEVPTLGDLNQLQYPEVYADVAARLAEYLPDGPLLFWGPFSYEDVAVKWLHRLVTPDGWAA